MSQKSAIQPTRDQDFPEWYQQVLKAADMAENSPVRGSMIIKPWGYAIWEGIRNYLDGEIKRTGHDNAYFPLFIPLSFLQKEAKHIEGFAKECAVVTHSRLEEKDGKLIPTGELEEPLIVRPTSETIIGDSFSRWVESWRDLPLKINQWANVVRWEMRPRIFLRTTEFLWQEGHTAHASEEEAREETLTMLEVYRTMAEEVLALPVITGEKSPGERFPGAVNTYTFEAMMQDRKALQCGTSHYLGQNFAKGFNIRFNNQQEQLEYAYTTSWGTTTRLIGGLIMVHADDDGLRLPPRIAPKQVVILPVIPNDDVKADVLQYSHQVAEAIRSQSYAGAPVSVHVDERDLRGGVKKWDWVKKGVPVRIEIGPRDLENKAVMMSRRDQDLKESHKMSRDAVAGQIPGILQEIQQNYYNRALEHRERHTTDQIRTIEEMREYFQPKNSSKPEIHGGFVLGKWCGDPATEDMLSELKVTIRCLPLEQRGTSGKCVLTGRDATLDAIFAKSY